MTLKHITAAAALALLSTTAVQAADWYVGGSVGQSDYKIDTSDATSTDKKDTGFKLFAGVRLMPNFAIEGGYVDLGKAKAAGPGFDVRVKATAPFIDAVGILPLAPQWDLFGRLGVSSTKIELSGTGVVSGSERSTAVHYGVGGQFNVNKSVSVRAEWERFRGKYNQNGDDLGKGDNDLLSVGVSFKF